MRLASTAIVLVASLALTAPPAPALTSFLVDTAESIPSGLPENTLYGDPVVWSLNLDPALVTWIGWNDQPTPYMSGGLELIGMGDVWIGTDDYLVLTIENPLGTAKSVIMDYNYFIAKSVGTQAVIFGQAATAPDVHRFYTGFGYNLTSPWTGHPSDPIPGIAWDGNVNQTTHHLYSDEDGAFNDIFTAAGSYEFTLRYGNSGNVIANHPDMYILVDGPASLVPEPAAMTLLGSLAGLLLASLWAAGPRSR